MSDEPKPGDPAPRPVPSEREKRLAAALRENLRRRKAQSRDRARDATQPPPQPPTGVEEG